MNVETKLSGNRNIRNELTYGEYQIINLVAKGLSNSEISKTLTISVNTVKFHLKNIYKKLQVHNRIAAINALNQTNQI